jgi:hypothetical protein
VEQNVQHGMEERIACAKPKVDDIFTLKWGI